ncbi:AraC family transcriptional regulator [Cohnella fermenti]|uniref:AraC family transcriptional regulator n=1 Tax=Cohnella fermenti TaxID=2565925 RepID=A0A4S4C915_9BACL|nr:AraC family transcriptional regulator [Cohnella fermenti]THF84542.1 AraC family transcriptional regulator [Cohnella fermenti]
MSSRLLSEEHDRSRAEFRLDQLTPKLWDIDILKGGPSWRIEPQLTDDHTMIVLLGGGGTLVRDSSSCTMNPETVYLAPAASTYSFEGGEGESVIAVVRFGLFRESDSGRERLLADPVKCLLQRIDGLPLAPQGRLAGLCRSIKEQHGSEDPLLRWKSQATLLELLALLFGAARRGRRMDSRNALELAKSHMDEHYGEELTIERLAGIADLSPKYFVDLFKKQYGISAVDYLTQIRIKKAKKLMISSEMRLKDIAHEVGYEDEFYFSRKFRKAVGISPSSFVKKRRNRLAVYGSASLLGYLMPVQVIPHAAPLHSKWAGFYSSAIGSDIAVHLDAYRHNQNKKSNLGLLAESKPDLILCPSTIDAMEREALSGIAELFVMPPEREGWRSSLLALADRLDERAEAERWIGEFEGKLGRARDKLGFGSLAPAPRVLPVRLIHERFYIHCNQGMTDVLFDGLGASFAYEGTPLPYDREIEMEELDESDADLILLLIRKETETLGGWKALQRSPRWLSLRAVRDNKVHLISSEPWREYSPIAVERILDISMEVLSGNRPF